MANNNDQDTIRVEGDDLPFYTTDPKVQGLLTDIRRLLEIQLELTPMTAPSGRIGVAMRDIADGYERTFDERSND